MSLFNRLITAAGVAAATLISAAEISHGQSEDALIKRGEYLVAVGGCTDCHTDGFLLGQPNPDLFLAGADNGFFIPELGVLYPSNLTPDVETGLGSWSRDDIVRALKDGVRPDGSPILPPMPITSTTELTDEDATAVAAYLQSLPPIRHEMARNPVPVEDAKGPYLNFVFPE